jgi:hypothetical protein
MSSYPQSEKRDVQTAFYVAVMMTSGGQDDPHAIDEGQIRMDLDTNRLIILRTAIYDENSLANLDRREFPWSVKDLLTGAIYLRNDDRFGEKVYAEMEAIAWAAQDHPEVDWLND